MKKNLIRTSSGVPVGAAVRTKDGEPGLEVQRYGIIDVISLKDLSDEVIKIINTDSIHSRKTEQGA